MNFLNNINIFLGIKVFNNLNLFTYNLFNFFYKLLIIKERPDYIKNWINHGFQNFEKIPNTYIDNLNNNLSNQEGLIINNLNTKKENDFFEFQITTEIKNNILNIVKEPLKPLLGNLKTYYKSDIILSNMSVRRNYNIHLIKKIILYQDSIDIYKKNNDFFLDNNGSIKNLENSIKKLVKLF